MPHLSPMPPPRSTDEDLLAAHLAGDRIAFSELWARHRPALLGYATRLLRVREEAEEVVHEAFLRAASGQWRPNGALRAWLFTVVHRMCIDAIRRRSRWTGLLGLLGHGAATMPAQEHGRERRDRETSLERALAAIPDEHRAILLLYYGQELRSREVAEILGCDDHQVRSKLSYARRLLREQLGEEE